MNNLNEERNTYTTGTWNGLPHFTCCACAFDTLEEEVMRAHVKGHETPTVAPSVAARHLPPIEEQDLAENDNDVFEVELVEIGSTVDAQGNEHKKYTVKEQ